jgi:dTDP-4-dehydrorhamnose 3,5-epimerase
VNAEPLALRGVTLLRADVHEDERGAFRRIVDVPLLTGLGLDATVVQISAATNLRRGTVRGMHWQAAPHEESKTLWCTHGSVFDVLVDLRADEPTYGQWVSVRLAADQPVALHVPPGIAHGYQTLEDDSALTYVISALYAPASARSLRWDDPTVGIEWPLDVRVISQRDREAPSWPPSP